MANYSSLKSAVTSVIKTNGNKEITGAVLQSTLLAIINSLGDGFLFKGVATPSTNPGTPDQNVFYIGGAGTYTNFNSLEVPTGYLGVLKYNGVWAVSTVQVGAVPVNDLTTGGTTVPLSAEMGKTLKTYHDNNVTAIQTVDGKVSQLEAKVDWLVDTTVIPTTNLLDLSTADMGKALTSRATSMTLSDYKSYETDNAEINTLAPITIPNGKYIVISYTNSSNPNTSRRTGTFKNFIVFDSDGNFLERHFSQGLWQNTTGSDVSVVVGIYDESVPGSYFGYAMIEVNDTGTPSATYQDNNPVYIFTLNDEIRSTMVLRFTGMSSSPNSADSGVTQVGDIFFRTTDNEFCKVISGSAGNWTTEEYCPPVEGAVYTLKTGELYLWNGGALVLADKKTREMFQHKIVYVASRTTVSFSGATITFGNGYFYGFNYAGVRIAKDMSGESYTLDGTDNTLVIDWNNGATLALVKQPYSSLTNEQTVLAHYDVVAGMQPSALLGPFFLKEKIDTLSEDVSELEDSIGSVRDFFKPELSATATSLNEKMAEPCLVFNIITDTHLGTGNADNARRNKDSVTNIVALNKLIRADGVIHLGDLLSVSMNTQPTDSLYLAMSEYITSLYESGVNVYPVIGNHDGPSVNAFNPNRWFAIAGRLNDSYTTHPATQKNSQNKVVFPAYYYKDFPDMNVRCIFLSIPESDERYTYALSDWQLKWLAEEALNVTQGTQILIFAHMSPFHGNVTSKPTQYEVLLGICTAFAQKTTYTKTDGGYNISADYTGKTGAKICAWLCGHSHFDNVANPGWTYSGEYHGEPHDYENEFSFPVIDIGAGLFVSSTDASYGGTVPSRTDKTITQDLWDTMVYRPDEGKIYLIRFGAGNDREITIPD